MAKVTIEISDTPEGKVNIQVTNDPPMEVNTSGTPAHRAAMRCLAALALAGEH